MGKIADALEKAGYGKEESKSKIPPEAQRPAKKRMPPKSPQGDLEDNTGSVPGVWDERLFNAVNSDQYIPEVFKILRSRILHPGNDKPAPKTIMVTSATPNEGKSFVTANLGVSLAQGMDQSCLLVNCDLRRPSLSTLFGMDGSRGLVDYLRDHEDLNGLIQKTSVNKLSVLPSGRPPVNPAELLGSSRMKALVEELSGRYEDQIIIFDSPPAQMASETAVLAGQLDGVILVVRQGRASKTQVQKLIEKFSSERIIGVVFNGHTSNFIEKSLMKGYAGYYPQGYY
jgi:protein-tyrosine kinase